MMLSGERTGFSPIRSIQGDIIRICDTSGNTVAEYTYGAWGKILSIKDGSGNDVSGNASHIANINPFRYRGYYYDTETGFYYLQTRYYDPEVGRFLNADCYIGANGDIPGYNMFAYCSNNPISRIDVNGTFWWVLIPVTVFLVGTLTGCKQNGNSSNVQNTGFVYKSIKGGCNTPNCYAYALQLTRAINPGDLSKTCVSFNDVHAVADAVIADLKVLGRSGRIINGPNDRIEANEYRIAVRCGTIKYKQKDKTGKYIYSFASGNYDYHFMVQTNDGKWAEKHGIGGNTILHKSGETPNSLPWSLGNLTHYYDSDIIYIAVTGGK